MKLSCAHLRRIDARTRGARDDVRSGLMVTERVTGRRSPPSGIAKRVLRRQSAGLYLVAALALAIACSRAQPSALDSARVAASSTAAALLSATPTSDPLVIASVDGRSPTPAPSASDAPPAPSASAMHAKPLGKARGSACASSRECRAGLACCQTGFSGHCGGANMPENTQPCVLLQTCAPSPCTPLSMPP
jgi:hypothetical protein